MEGVMTGIVDRENHAEIPFVGIGSDEGAMVRANETDGIRSLINNNTDTTTKPNINNYDISKLSPSKTNFEKSMNMADYIMGRYGSKKGIGSDSVAQALIQGGLRAIGGAGAGKGVLGELATAFEPVVGEAFKQKQKERDTKMGLAVELYKGMSKDDRLAFERKAEEYAKLKGISKEEAMLQFLEKDLSEASPNLKEATVYTDANNLLKQWSTEPPQRIMDLDDIEQKNVALFEVKDFRTRAKGGELENISSVYPSAKNLVEVPEEEAPDGSGVKVFEYLPKTSKSGKTEEIPFQVGQQYFIPGIGPRGSIAVYNPDRKFRIIKQVQ